MAETGSPSGSPPNSVPPAPPLSKPKRRRRWLFFLVGGFVVLAVLGGGGFVAATTLEEHDSFCIICHTAPESTYFNRVTAASSTSAPVTDLASMHYHQAQAKDQTFACINCHRGDSSLDQRTQTLMLGARDVGIFLSGKSDQTLEKTTITQPELPNDGCISCHTDTMLTVKGTPTHMHNWLPQTAQLVAQGKQLITTNNSARARRLRTVNTSITCTSCHLAHITVPNGQQSKFIDTTLTQKACDTCHKDAGERPESLDRLLRETR